LLRGRAGTKPLLSAILRVSYNKWLLPYVSNTA
jgi:hypothetical protein